MKTLALFTTLALLATPAAAATRVIDGDTIEVDGLKIRIAEIDTPETGRARCQREFELGQAAKQRLAELLAGGELTVVVVSPTGGGFGRALGYVFVGEVDVGQTLLEEGLALKWTRGPVAKAARMAVWCPVPARPLPH
jgi:endonuclease YncB( thermonuclease family)